MTTWATEQRRIIAALDRVDRAVVAALVELGFVASPRALETFVRAELRPPTLAESNWEEGEHDELEAEWEGCVGVTPIDFRDLGAAGPPDCCR